MALQMPYQYARVKEAHEGFLFIKSLCHSERSEESSSINIAAQHVQKMLHYVQHDKIEAAANSVIKPVQSLRLHNAILLNKNSRKR
ncbi:hypothetical protein SAMN04487890_108140 [Mucilaginibacter polytrichastri]|nr:hypothetical protein SAMN04487890_108140 [Mucilaginibacter polytrichastri]